MNKWFFLAFIFSSTLTLAQNRSDCDQFCKSELQILETYRPSITSWSYDHSSSAMDQVISVLLKSSYQAVWLKGIDLIATRAQASFWHSADIQAKAINNILKIGLKSQDSLVHTEALNSLRSPQYQNSFYIRSTAIDAISQISSVSKDTEVWKIALDTLTISVKSDVFEIRASAISKVKLIAIKSSDKSIALTGIQIIGTARDTWVSKMRDLANRAINEIRTEYQ